MEAEIKVALKQFRKTIEEVLDRKEEVDKKAREIAEKISKLIKEELGEGRYKRGNSEAYISFSVLEGEIKKAILKGKEEFNFSIDKLENIDDLKAKVTLVFYIGDERIGSITATIYYY